jgi:hypothetical protein
MTLKLPEGEADHLTDEVREYVEPRQTRLIAPENCIESCRRQSFISYVGFAIIHTYLCTVPR